MIPANTSRSVRTAARISAALQVDSGDLVEDCVRALSESVPDYVDLLADRGESVSTVAAALASMFLSAVQNQNDLLLYEFWDSLRSMGRRRCAQGMSLESLLAVVAVHKAAVMRAIELRTGDGKGVDEVLLLAQRRLDTALEKHTLSLTRGYVDGMQERYQEQQGVLRALISIAGAMNRSLEVSEVAETGLKETLKAMGLDSGGLWIPGPNSDELVLAYSSGMTWDEDRALREEPVRVGGGDVVGTAAAFEGPVHGHFRAQQAIVKGDWSGVGLGLRAKGKLVGVLAVGSRQRRQFTRNELGFLGAVVDHLAVALDRAYQHRREARTDLLTGIANRAEFERAIQREVASSERHGHPLTLMLLDLDDLKSINDRFGHQAGDEAIRLVADALRSVVRASDTCSRLGGDEFAVAMPQADERQANEVALRIRDSLAVPRGGDELSIPLSVSVGIAGWAPGLDPSRIYQLADARLYRDKRRKQARLRRQVQPPVET